jgi:hypothetical protein
MGRECKAAAEEALHRQRSDRLRLALASLDSPKVKGGRRWKSDSTLICVVS